MRSRPACVTLPDVPLAGLSRLADAERWGEAVARGLGWAPGTFTSTLRANRAEANELTLEESPVAVALIDLAIRCPLFRGTMQELLPTLAALRRHPWSGPPIGRGVRELYQSSSASSLPSSARLGSMSSSAAKRLAGS